MQSQGIKKYHLPDKPGVYFFKKGREILYIGRATSLKDRVRSYFSNDLIATRGPLLVDMVTKADGLDFETTDSVLEAIVLEANLIKKYQPYHNSQEKDDKSFNYVIITDEAYPRVLIERGRILNLENEKFGEIKLKYVFGPFTQGMLLKEALRLVRKIFPFRDKCLPESGRPCFNAQIGLCPGVCSGKCSRKDYQKTINHLRLFFSGKKKTLVTTLKREMKVAAKAQAFELAAEYHRQLEALEHIQDVSLLKREKTVTQDTLRIEAYDVAHLAGDETVGSMTVVEDGEAKKSDYRKFKLVSGGRDDLASLRELLTRRLKHEDWPTPNIIVIDGGENQLKVAREEIKKVERFSNTKIVSVVKNEAHKPRAILGDDKLDSQTQNAIILANAEAHRFAIAFNRFRTRRSKFQ